MSRKGEIYSHYKTGNLYVIMHDNVPFDADGRPTEMVVVYRSVKTEKIYAKPVSEFYQEVTPDKQQYNATGQTFKYERLRD